MAGINYQLRSTVVVIMVKLLLLLLQGWSCEACLEEDRFALLRLKDSFNTPYGGFAVEVMLSWRKEVDCCEWDGVGCDTTTGRVNELMLRGFRGGDFADNWYFNASMFLPFQELRNLNLVLNNIVCCVEDEGFEELQKLSKLELLNLGGNNLNVSILPLLRGLQSLRYLYIWGTQQKGSINMEDLVALSNLEELDIWENNFDKFVVSKDIEGLSNISVLYIDNFGSKFQLQSLRAFPNLNSLYLSANNFTLRALLSQDIDSLSNISVLSIYDFGRNVQLQEPFSQGLSNFKNLKELYLDFVALGNINSFLESIANMTSLETLSLRQCELSGNIRDTGGLCKLENLRILSLNDNSLSGVLPHCLVNLTLLQELDLSHNYFSGNVHQSPLIGLTSITYLSLSHNQFKFPSSLSPFLNHSKLKSFYGDENEIYGETWMINHSLTPKFQLERLSLQSTPGGGSFPEFLYHQHDLQYLDISGIPMIRSSFPSWLLENNTKLESLSLSNCSLSGSMVLPACTPNATLRMLDISTNQLYGCIPIEIGTIFPRLEELILSENRFIGSIPNSLSNCSLLKALIMRDNQLFGKVPQWIGTKDSLLVLDLVENKFSGSLSAIFGTPWLQVIQLSKNKFEGPFPHSISNLHHLKVLDLSHNYLTGIIPKWIGKLFNLKILLLNYNNFIGEIPINLWMMTHSLNFVDLSHNKLSSFSFSTNYLYNHKKDTSYFKFFYFNSTKEVFEFVIKGNIFKPKIEYILSTGFIGLDFSCNNLNGPIPFEFGNIQNIKLLNLSRNTLIGSIPLSFSNMTEIETLDLSFNHLNGSIPFLLTELNFLEAFNVSYNNLSGETPTRVAQFATFDETSYSGNPFLCGLPLPKSCRNEETTTPSPMTKKSSDDDDGAIDMEVFHISFSVTFVIILGGIAGVLCINPYWRKAWFYFIQMVIDSCYYFVLDCLSYLSRLWER